MPMSHEAYVAAVERGEYPTDPHVPARGDSFVDGRGIITNVLVTPIAHASIITSAKGAVRANHWHRTDWHYTHVFHGRVVYFVRDVGSKLRPRVYEFSSGDTFFTPPNVEHAMLFAAPTTILTFARNVRTHDAHEDDVVRVESLVTPEDMARYL